MKCHGKEIIVNGILDTGKEVKFTKFAVMISNDEAGKTISISQENADFPHFHLNAEQIAKYLEGNYKK